MSAPAAQPLPPRLAKLLGPPFALVAGAAAGARSVPMPDGTALVADATVGDAEFARVAALAAALVETDRGEADQQAEIGALSEQLSDAYEELSLIYHISGGMTVNRAPDDFFADVCAQARATMGVRATGVVLCSDDGPTSPLPDAPRLAQGTADQARVVWFGDAPNPIAPPLLGRAVVAALQRSGGKPIVAEPALDDARFAHALQPVQGARPRGLLAVPMQRNDRLVGALFCLDKQGDSFGTQDIKLLGAVAVEAAIYLHNAALFADSHGLLMGLLHALTSAVDAKDAYTNGHSQRVARYGRELARCAGLGEAAAQRVYMAGLLHDVGKIGIPEAVLQKAGRLTDEEFALMKTHVDVGARILRDVPQVADLVPGVLHHHERYDGKGYPHKLAGDAIPTVARILCLADCFDAMTSNRTYRKALALDVALGEIKAGAGTQFDPALAEAFLRAGPDRLRLALDGVATDNTILLLPQQRAAA